MFENLDTAKTALSDLGEFGLIKHLTQNGTIQQNTTQKGIGDDAAVLDFDGQQCVLSTDLLIEGVHFDLSYVPLKHLGYKAVVVNLSDIYAMNAIATQITVSIAVSNRFTLEALEDLYEGIYAAAKTYKVDLVGGDTTSSNRGLIISITAIGHARQKDLVYRDGAKENDLLVVTGDLGAAYLGLQILEREKQVFRVNPNNQPDLDPYTYVVQRQLKPEARKDIVHLLQSMQVHPTSMIDISDGLSSEVLHLATQSKLGVQVYEEKIPIDPTVVTVSEEFNLHAATVALNGGEDYELLFTIGQNDYDTIKANPKLSVIGHMTQAHGEVALWTRTEEKIKLKARGWNAISTS